MSLYRLSLRVGCHMTAPDVFPFALTNASVLIVEGTFVYIFLLIHVLVLLMILDPHANYKKMYII